MTIESVHVEVLLEELTIESVPVEVLLEELLHRVPELENATVAQQVNGPESFTPDGRLLLGHAPEVRGTPPPRPRGTGHCGISPPPHAPQTPSEVQGIVG